MTAAVKRLFLVFALALAGCAGEAPTFDDVAAGLSPAPANGARLFVYRDFEPYQSLSWVPVFLNGKEVGAVGPGYVIMRDLPPGGYRIEAKSEGLWPEQAKTVSIAAGETVYAKITSFKSADPSSNNAGATITTFVVTLVDAATGRREIASLWYTARRQRPAAAG
ncbi:MAG TPA: hypothetical protein VEI03_02600 [Stellaceae bacterium]|nr:hypothetical protein [Stellaceae bacterium]